jgi:putative hemolysin
MSNPTLEVLFILLLISANGVFALAEIAVISARKARLHQRADQGDARAKAALELANSPGEFLSTVQIGITLVGILTGAFGGATLARSLGERLKPIPALAPYSDAIALVLVVLPITSLSLVIGELLPKRLALTNPERFASLLAPSMRLLSRIAAPAVVLLNASTGFFLRLFGMVSSQEPPVTEEEIKILIQQGTRAGVFHEAEQEMVEEVLRLGDLRASQLMQPRTGLVWLAVEDPPDGTWRKIVESGGSLFPVYEGTYDHVVGIVEARDLLGACLSGKPLDLRAAARSPLFVPETMRALQLLELFKQTGQTAALVLDEYGGTQGLVTPSDLLEAIVGALPAPGEPVEPQMLQREDGSWLVDGLTPIHDLKETLDLDALPDEGGRSYDTVGGFVMRQLGRIPATGDHFVRDGFRFEVVDMDGHRVDKVLVAAEQRNAPQSLP